MWARSLSSTSGDCEDQPLSLLIRLRRHAGRLLPKTFWILAGCVIVAAGRAVTAEDNGTCLACHGQQDMGMRYVNEHLYAQSIHGKNACTSCHGHRHEVMNPRDPQSSVNRWNIPTTCGRCHPQVLTAYRESIHGQANQAGAKEAPVCTDCHGEHTIRSPRDPSSTVWRGAVTKTCSGCHGSERITLKFGLPTDRLASYLETYHGLASQRGDLRVAHCASCHGYHDVLPSSDPKSSIAKANLANTCSRCHPGAGRQLTLGSVHGSPTATHWSLAFAQRFYKICIPLVIGLMLLHNGLDLLRKMIAPSPSARMMAENPIRLTTNERWQHAGLMVTFVLLAYSGFALKFPQAAWVKVLTPFSEVTRRLLHRWAACVFCMVGLYHVGYLVGTRRGRMLLAALFLRRLDLMAVTQHVAYTLGFRKDPPERRGFYHYTEKVEYWSLVWGSLIMVITGGLLVFINATLQYFPLWMSDLVTLVHYYEAVLACLAILVWHGYLVIFDPEVYPMNWAWLTGRVRRRTQVVDRNSDPPSQTPS